MLIEIPNVFSKQEVNQLREQLDARTWIDGNQTSGMMASTRKRNQQLDKDDPVALQIGELIMARLLAHPLFVSAALPLQFYPPLFNRYQGGDTFGYHIDNAIRSTSDGMVRTDLSATLFLSELNAYEGGELVIQDTYGQQSIKLAAGSLVLYPSTSLHQVTPVTSGERTSAFMWLQSMVRDEGQRRLLFQLDQSIQTLTAQQAAEQELFNLTGVYHNLLRRWSEL
ncbi:Fe2+-dependent dioxygenase [Shewanella oneidensis MR-1]|uniref:PKHD-type hydroxylase SO_3913 n=1 Tax=Shewanella oneidensis (strain ATCC 700550 / JCM 31522 / CIP 106686 / LMG 19005 / NCIMB 14063 / MR-1) TaxID=211586 RepID=Y3913_SHEON|nr:Fe2+-dependent dioxygenase [Shewanella oneidensis]Q8EAI9.1 RecName: Full=PKHD-type hydroxylase SO_3913 [Shewanella oneidensis MR-1]AAN56888.1 Fur regulated PKHD-type hydroxylase PiuC [Shewanella oneidensis MR-1]MDX5998752.1 Fe2+-dependent dioxygenase [Shewanella oneidensis]MEE2027928.1 PKHD-type hydroxylase [Shewanella oneidensis]QKG98209.1 Fe2+-dependent dioxygenase [Shewanella oneidensis MR-1]